MKLRKVHVRKQQLKQAAAAKRKAKIALATRKKA
jgi:hypothetical protein